MNRAPDIEIYVPNITAEQAEDWLQKEFSKCELSNKKKGMPKKAHPISVEWNNLRVSGVVYEKVVPGFTSIWLDSDQLPWSSDQEFAQSAAKHFHCAVRFVNESWQQQQNPDAWNEINEQGEITDLIWKT